ncbi:hypothetical protein H4O09_03335 [Stenotrophomonas sp. W1S232]|uniref:Uncharacterized protein n=1 Tax=Stenotrophomonas koreensis TaxID=266128 RepID=A0A7W3YTJ4_9GAMM|nr:hypothetical protein [Stenotrophomonas koreensis]MBB1116101.1 hypothetical protein [Stenotrophomonas koreensis]
MSKDDTLDLHRENSTTARTRGPTLPLQHSEVFHRSSAQGLRKAFQRTGKARSWSKKQQNQEKSLNKQAISTGLSVDKRQANPARKSYPQLHRVLQRHFPTDLSVTFIHLKSMDYLFF